MERIYRDEKGGLVTILTDKTEEKDLACIERKNNLGDYTRVNQLSNNG